MDNSNWLDKPQEISQINAVPILPTTIKALKDIANNYRRTGMQPIWRTTQFQNVAIVARILKNGEKMVLSDNTDILVHHLNKPPIGTKFFLRHQYYRFIFEITPYSSDSLNIVNVQVVMPDELATHLSQVLQEDLRSQLHQQLSAVKVVECKKQVKVEKQESDIKERVLKAIANWNDFTLEDVEQVVGGSTSEKLAQVLQELSEIGKIGDMGSYYVVVPQIQEQSD